MLSNIKGHCIFFSIVVIPINMIFAALDLLTCMQNGLHKHSRATRTSQDHATTQ